MNNVDMCNIDKCNDLFFNPRKIPLSESNKQLKEENLTGVTIIECEMAVKDIQDFYGLWAGEEAIYAASIALYQCFGGSKIYRTSYKTYVVLCPDEKDQIEENILQYKELIANWHGIIAPKTTAVLTIRERLPIE